MRIVRSLHDVASRDRIRSRMACWDRHVGRRFGEGKLADLSVRGSAAARPIDAARPVDVARAACAVGPSRVARPARVLLRTRAVFRLFEGRGGFVGRRLKRRPVGWRIVLRPGRPDADERGLRHNGVLNAGHARRYRVELSQEQIETCDEGLDCALPVLTLLMRCIHAKPFPLSL